ncbi:MAG TPA: phage holin family protein [Noviherbaspirillum sp.]|uniref:phage holin family protein n=1 Tax=Noviherbaspirillum sp. TaxID=1926288 RepID=UPI002D692435|nr:phage holin family protein [Noviherbaspirillum sp.]HYD96410.1 phage holin family protein [Noviherbaspirillum sp.]
MVFAESLARLAATLLAMAQNRVELAATELEEESLRYFSYLMLSLAAMFCIGIAVVLGVLLAVVLYWESHRVAILATLTAAFAIVGIMIARHVRNLYRSKPKLLGHTAAELGRDTELLQPPA